MTVLFEVEEKFRSRRQFLIFLAIISFIIAITITIILLVRPIYELAQEQAILAIALPWGLVLGCFIVSFIKDPPGIKELRSCSITEEEIEFKIPSKKNFTIKWTDFDSIHAHKEKIVGYRISSSQSGRVYSLVFKGTKKRTFRFEKYKFKSRTRYKIFKALDKIAPKMNKKFIWEYY